MKGLTRNQLHQIKESLDLATFCKKWWKHLSKEIKRHDLSDTQKLLVFTKMIEGLTQEAISCAHETADFESLKQSLQECIQLVVGGY